MKQLTIEQKRSLRHKAKSEIERIESIFNEKRTLHLLDSFKNKFNICESAYKIILLEYQRTKGKTMPLEKLKLTMTQVPFALNFAGYDFSSELLNELFGSESKINGCKTVKILRDSITHGINEKCIDEIENRQEELFVYMDTFLDSIKNFDEWENQEMKYYGYMYEGMAADYEALDFINKQWQDNPDLQIARLLVVKKSDCRENAYAFFQFTDYNACVEFIKNNENIIWSRIDSPKWNGNAKMMG